MEKVEKSIQILTYISFNGTKITGNKCLSEQVFNQFSFFHRFELIFADFRNDFEKKIVLERKLTLTGGFKKSC